MIEIDKQSRIPIYEQIIEQFERQILSGILELDEVIPSVRSLSLELSINPNTIQKAYNELERRGITYSVPGVGRFVSKFGSEILKNDNKESLAKLKDAIENLKLSGLSLGQILEKVTELYGGKSDD